MFEFFDILQSQAVPLFWAGAALIVVNVVTHAAIDRYEQRRRDREKVERNLKPLLRATGDLISRISEILITRNASIVAAIKDYRPGRFSDRIESLRSTNLNRHESTAYRLVNFLAVSAYLTRQTADVSPFPLLDRIDYFVQHKIAVGLRGISTR